MGKFGMFVSNEDKNVFSLDPKDLSFSSDFDMFKIKQEGFSQASQILSSDHGLNYFPFFLAYIHNSSITDGRAFNSSGINNLSIAFVTVWSYTFTGYIFIAFNPGVRNL